MKKTLCLGLALMAFGCAAAVAAPQKPQRPPMPPKGEQMPAPKAPKLPEEILAQMDEAAKLRIDLRAAMRQEHPDRAKVMEINDRLQKAQDAIDNWFMARRLEAPRPPEGPDGEEQPERFGPGPRNFGPGPRGFGPGPRGFGPGPRNFGPGPRGFGPGPRDFGPGPRGFGPGPRDFGPGPRDFGPGPRDFGPGPRNFGPGPRDFGPGPRNFGPGPRDFGPGPRDFGPGPRDFGPGPDGNCPCRGFGPGPRDFGPGCGENGCPENWDQPQGQGMTPPPPVPSPEQMSDAGKAVPGAPSHGNMTEQNSGVGDFNSGSVPPPPPEKSEEGWAAADRRGDFPAPGQPFHWEMMPPRRFAGPGDRQLPPPPARPNPFNTHLGLRLPIGPLSDEMRLKRAEIRKADIDIETAFRLQKRDPQAIQALQQKRNAARTALSVVQLDETLKAREKAAAAKAAPVAEKVPVPAPESIPAEKPAPKK